MTMTDERKNHRAHIEYKEERKKRHIEALELSMLAFAIPRPHVFLVQISLSRQGRGIRARLYIENFLDRKKIK